MKKKALALAVAGAFFAPASYAAQDSSGMQYTSAAEGFYASIRARFATEATTNAGAGIGNSFSRFGIRGSNDLGNGLQGFYQYEAGVDTHNGGNVNTRLGQVGLEGAFGRVWAGSGWTETHNMTYGSTDIANHGSGNLTYTDLRPGRANNMIQYRTPDISGFQAAFGIQIAGGSDNDKRMTTTHGAYMYSESGVSPIHYVHHANGVQYTHYTLTDPMAADAPNNRTYTWDDDNDNATPEVPVGRTTPGNVQVNSTNHPAALARQNPYQQGDRCDPTVLVGQQRDDCTRTTTTAPTSPGDDNNVDMWSFAAQYSVQGFTGAFAYSVRPDTAMEGAMGTEDATAWTARLGYAQDNWYVNGWYGKDNTRDLDAAAVKDAKYASVGGGVSVGAVNLYAVYEAGHNGKDQANVTSVLGIQYNLGSRSRVWMDYIGKDFDTDASQEDHIGIGLRHDF